MTKTPGPASRKPVSRHPALGLAPVDMRVGFTNAAETLRHDRTVIAAQALGIVVEHDGELKSRFTEKGMADLLHDAELLTERLAMCLSSADTRWLAEYAEWIGPILRRRGVAQSDMAAILEGIRETVAQRLSPEVQALAGRSIDAAAEVFRKNGRIGGDTHKRNALLRWLYRGV